MSPEIKRNNVLIARVPDETGMHKTLDGNPLYVNVDGINAHANRQSITLDSEEIGGKRIVGLTQQGIGTSSDPKRGDRQMPTIVVSLLDKPIRVSYKRREWISSKSLGSPTGGQYREYKDTYKNPRWTRGHGQR